MLALHRLAIDRTRRRWHPEPEILLGPEIPTGWLWNTRADDPFEEARSAARVFTEFDYRTKKIWSCSRRVVAKAEYLDKGENPRFVITSLLAEQWAAQDLYEKFYCVRGEMENRIKKQMCLFADRLSTDEMNGNQLRLYFSALVYTLAEALRRLALKGTAWAEARADNIRLKLLKVGAVCASACAAYCSNSVPPTHGRYLRGCLPRPALLTAHIA